MRKAPMMRLRAGMNLAGGRGRVDEVVGARSRKARLDGSAESSVDLPDFRCAVADQHFGSVWLAV